VLAEDKLFATLDPSQRKLFIPCVKSQTDEEHATFPGRSVVLSDTVGFIRALPVELESAFRATLEELYDASLLLHVVDAADPEAREKYQAVRRILDSMELGDIPELVVANKVDQLEKESDFEWFQDGKAFLVSALRREGFQDLLVAIDGQIPKTHWAANQ
jgi:GTP-binding protein HflX